MVKGGLDRSQRVNARPAPQNLARRKITEEENYVLIHYTLGQLAAPRQIIPQVVPAPRMVSGPRPPVELLRIRRFHCSTLK